MKSLYQRLKKENKASVDRHGDRYPYITQEMIESLKEIKFIHKMSYGLWIDLRQICSSYEEVIETPYELFND